MSEEYLWDKSGEPDPEIQELEELLGTLRYQPKPLELPDDIKPVRRNRYLPLIAIAATLVIALLTGALWSRVKTDSKPEQFKAVVQPSPIPSITNTSNGPNKEDKEAVKEKSTPSNRPQDFVARNNIRRRNRPSSLSETQRKEALEAKEQLMVAMRLASEKLNIVQRKTHGPATPGQIRNQHKVG